MIWHNPRVWEIHFDEYGNYTGDYFNLEDRTRWVDNINYLHQESLKFTRNYEIIPLVIHQIGHIDTAGWFNAVETNLQTIANQIGAVIKPRGFWTEQTPYVTDFNRIEQGMEIIKTQIEKVLSSLHGMPLKMGDRGVDVLWLT